ncbi:MAG TPA: hypothetical protein VF484_08115 [Candidatus Limnocylindrales bacterium]
MDWTGPVAFVIAVALGMALMWRPPRGRRRNLEEALAEDELHREQEQTITRSQYLADRFNVPGRGRKF